MNILIHFNRFKMVSILAIGDIHIQNKNLEDVAKFKKKLRIHLQTTKYDMIVCMGDTLNDHRDIDSICQNTADDYFELLGEFSHTVPTQILVGNHDYISNSQFLTQNHWLKKYHKTRLNVQIVDHVKMIKIKGYNFILLPYVPDGRFREALGETLSEPVTAIFGHQLLDGVKMGPIIAKNVESWHYPIQMYMGHIHDKQILPIYSEDGKKTDKTIVYVGSCMQHAFGESKDKTVLHIKVSPKDGNFTHTEINLNPTKKQIVYTSMSKLEKIMKKIYDTRMEKLINGDLKLKISVNGSYEEYKEFKRSENYKKATKLGLKIEYNEKRIGKEVKGEIKNDARETKNEAKTETKKGVKNEVREERKENTRVKIDFFDILHKSVHRENDRDLSLEYEKMISKIH